MMLASPDRCLEAETIAAARGVPVAIAFKLAAEACDLAIGKAYTEDEPNHGTPIEVLSRESHEPGEGGKPLITSLNLESCNVPVALYRCLAVSSASAST
ncbi:MAG: hypothetical protein OXK20_05435 [Deltaproteobacteria bacterium]|nr:hypothetical protein [Deltaproteobacteria bacterium]